MASPPQPQMPSFSAPGGTSKPEGQSRQAGVAAWKEHARLHEARAEALAAQRNELEEALRRERLAHADLLLRYELLRSETNRDVSSASALAVVEDGVGARIGEAYGAWCRQGGPLVGRAFMFERVLQRPLPGASVQALFWGPGDQSAEAGTPVWIVEAQERAYAVPAVLNADRFAEGGALFVFADDVRPAAVATVQPARLLRHATGYRFEVLGHIA